MPKCECHDEEMYFNPDRRMTAGGFWVCRTSNREACRSYYHRNGFAIRQRQTLARHRKRLATLEARLAGE